MEAKIALPGYDNSMGHAELYALLSSQPAHVKHQYGLALLKTATHFIDFEASGLHPDSYPIEVAVSSERESYQAFIKPVYYWTYWSHDAQDMHGISRERIIAEGLDADEVAAALNEHFAGQILWASSSHDKFWLDVLFEASTREPTFHLDNIYKYLDPRLWRNVSRSLPQSHAHRATEDAKALGKAIQTVIRDLETTPAP